MLGWKARMVCGALAAAVARSGWAQGVASSAPPTSIADGQFGTATNQSIVPIQSFVGLDTSQVFAGTTTGYYYASSASDATLWAPLGLPPGTDVSSVCLEVFDNDDFEGLIAALVGGETGSAGNPAPAFVALAAASTGGVTTTGFTSRCLSPAGVFSFPLRVRNEGNLDGIGATTLVQYYLLVGLPATAVAQAVMSGPAVVTWTRAITTGPQVATFQDVPTTDAYYHVVEAANAAGIMTTCDGGPNFCPQAPVTREQLAMFLARALGLHWPN